MREHVQWRNLYYRHMLMEGIGVASCSAGQVHHGMHFYGVQSQTLLIGNVINYSYSSTLRCTLLMLPNMLLAVLCCEALITHYARELLIWVSGLQTAVLPDLQA